MLLHGLTRMELVWWRSLVPPCLCTSGITEQRTKLSFPRPKSVLSPPTSVSVPLEAMSPGGDLGSTCGLFGFSHFAFSLNVKVGTKRDSFHLC